MLKKRIIPILLFDGNQAVQSIQFKRPHRRVGSMMQHVKVMEKRGIDELIILDVNATLEKRAPLFDQIKDFAGELFCPLTYGGGINCIEHVDELIQRCGADKVAISSAACRDPGLLNEIGNKYGAQSVVYSMDISHHKDILLVNGMDISIRLLANIASGFNVGEILLTAVYKNGTKKGYDTNLLASIASVSRVPVIINGGCGEPAHMAAAFDAGADAVAASTMFLFSDYTPRECAKYLIELNHPVRVENEHDNKSKT